MILERRQFTYRPNEFNPAANAFAAFQGTKLSWNFNRSYPVEYLLVLVHFAVTVALATQLVGSITTPDMWDGLLNLVQRFTVTTNDGIKANRNVVDISGVRALEYCAQSGINLPPECWNIVQLMQQRGAAAVPVGTYTMPYLVPIVDFQVGEPLRSHLLLPVHTHKQDPTLSITFNTPTNMGITAGTINTVAVTVKEVRAINDDRFDTWLAKRYPLTPFGYIEHDLIEQTFSLPTGQNTIYRAALMTPGWYLNLMFSQYRGGAALTKDVVDFDLGDTVANNFGNETIWDLETSNTPRHTFRWKELLMMNSFTRCQNNIPTNAAAAAIPNLLNISPDFVLTKDLNGTATRAATAFFRTPALAMLDFMSDPISGNTGAELGSVLDVQSISDANLKLELVGRPASVATNPSVIAVVGRRLTTSPAPFQIPVG